MGIKELYNFISDEFKNYENVKGIFFNITDKKK